MTPRGRYVLRVEPQRGDGYLREPDVHSAVEGLPPGARVRMVLTDCDDFAASAAAWLARRLAGSDVTTEYERCPPRFAREWEAAYDRAADDYRDGELGLLA